jgi:hypothetical protein
MSSATLCDLFSDALFNSRMTSEEARRENLKTLISAVGGVAAMGRLLGHSNSTQVSQWLNASPESKTGKRRNISPTSARKIESVCNKPRGWLDVDHTDMPAAPPPTTLATLTPPPDPLTAELLELARGMSRDGLLRLVERANILAAQYPKAKANHAQ